MAIGLVMAFDLSVRLGLCPAADAARVARHFRAIGLPTRPPSAGGRRWPADRLIAHMQRDKKVAGGRITFVLARGIGQAFIANDVPLDAVTALLEGSLAA